MNIFVTYPSLWISQSAQINMCTLKGSTHSTFIQYLPSVLACAWSSCITLVHVMILCEQRIKYTSQSNKSVLVFPADVNIITIIKTAQNMKTSLSSLCVSHSSFSLPAVLRRARGIMKEADVRRKQVWAPAIQ